MKSAQFDSVVQARIANVILVVVNDGDGSACGMTYKQRCAAAALGIGLFRDACYKAGRTEYGAGFSRQMAIKAADRVQEYYRQHMQEIARLNKMEGIC